MFRLQPTLCIFHFIWDEGDAARSRWRSERDRGLWMGLFAGWPAAHATKKNKQKRETFKLKHQQVYTDASSNHTQPHKSWLCDTSCCLEWARCHRRGCTLWRGWESSPVCRYLPPLLDCLFEMLNFECMAGLCPVLGGAGDKVWTCLEAQSKAPLAR